jgi:hypothetical protein
MFGVGTPNRYEPPLGFKIADHERQSGRAVAAECVAMPPGTGRLEYAVGWDSASPICRRCLECEKLLTSVFV